MALDDVGICANALLRLGANEIQSFTEENDRAKLCSNIYPQVKRDMLSRYGWRFLTAKAKLARLTLAPLSGWTYQYQLPSDRAINGAIIVYTSDQPNTPAFKDYEIQDSVLLTDETEIWIDYSLEDIDEQQFPGYFTELMIAVMVQKLAFPITDQQNVADAAFIEAFGLPGEQGYGGLYGQARNRDAQTQPVSVFTDFTLVLARNGGLGAGGNI
jgi:hypothetical protein